MSTLYLQLTTGKNANTIHC